MTRAGCRTWIAAGLVAVVCLTGRPAPLFAQDAGEGKAKVGPRPANQRPQGDPLQVGQVDAQLMQVLKNWETASGRITSLQGEHRRFVYDSVFAVEKRADGVFYYESPDKGRMDIRPGTIRKGEQSKRLDEKQVPYELKPDAAEKWICNGQEIMQLNDDKKEIERIKIPPDAQGVNIMDGPLPFLFGMPADKAMLRYNLTLKQNAPNQVWLDVLPRWKQDAVNWKKAQVILDKKSYLPTAVKLWDPAGTSETVYTFTNFKVNQPNKGGLAGWFGKGDPFNPPELEAYKQVMTDKPGNGNGKVADNAGGVPPQNPRPDVRPPAVGKNKPVVPNVIGLWWEDAREELKKAGCQNVKFIRGNAARRSEKVFEVYEQQPPPNSPLDPAQPIRLTLYDKVAPENAKAEE